MWLNLKHTLSLARTEASSLGVVLEHSPARRLLCTLHLPIVEPFRLRAATLHEASCETPALDCTL